MNTRSLFYISLIIITLIITSCTEVSDRDSQFPDDLLPPGYSIATVTNAIEEKINHILWSNPDEIYIRPQGSEPYVGQQVTVEVRSYTDTSGNKKVYTHMDVDIWKDVLFTFENINGIIYYTGEVLPEQELWPTDNYEIVDKMTVTVPPLREPKFGTSPRKDQMIGAVENNLKAFCQDTITGSDKDTWLNSEVYIVDFFEYEQVALTLIIQQNGTVYNHPVSIQWDPENNNFSGIGGKGFEIENLTNLGKDDPARFLFDRQLQTIVKRFSCTRSGLK